MMSDIGMRSMPGNAEYSEDLGLLIREQRRQEVAASDREKELSIYRSGSAPPTVEGSLSAVGGLFVAAAMAAIQGLRRRRSSAPIQRGAGGGGSGSSSSVGGIGDRRKVGRGGDGNGSSLFSMQPGFNGQKDENGAESRKAQGVEWGGDGLIGLPGLGLGSRQKSLAEIIQGSPVGQGECWELWCSQHPEVWVSMERPKGLAMKVDLALLNQKDFDWLAWCFCE
ncbi:Pumilio-like 1 [Vitis vinifera]|uniref:Pumilio-like 1 n=1 Tax=Vitis vinifera TaxID=29760 RepID=A0A438ENL2_VITVI|nr:Pumilio-like 1 [Vitis vinifera]